MYYGCKTIVCCKTVALLLIGGFLASLLRITGLTKTTVVSGGDVAEIFHTIASLILLTGEAFLLYLLMFQADYVVKIVSIVFGD